MRVDAAERDEQAVGVARRRDHLVVGRRVAVGLVHREHERAARVGERSAVSSSSGLWLHPVGVVLAEVRVGVEQLEPGHLVADQLDPGRDSGHRDPYPDSYHERDGRRRSPIPGRSAASRSRTGWCSRRWPESATGSCASRPSATGPGWRSRRWSRASRSTTATSAPAASCCASTRDEHPVSVQLFGHDPEVMASAAERVAAAGADLIDINMGCPVPKVCKTGAGAALLDDPTRAVAVARAAARGSGLPVTVKLRTGLRPGDRSGRRAGSAARRAWRRRRVCDPSPPRLAAPQRPPDYALAARARRGAAGAGADLRRPAHARRSRARRSSGPAPRRCCWLAARSATRGCSSSCSGARGPTSRAARRSWPSSTGCIECAVEHLGERARHSVPAEVLPLVRRAPRRRARASGGAPDRADPGRRRTLLRDAGVEAAAA